MTRTRQRGVALLTVLLLVAVMSLLLMGMLDDIRFGLRRAGNAQSVAQAQWHALGAETLARTRIERLAARDPVATTLDGGWNGRAFVFPVEHGAISGRITDGTACFNLNSVVEGAGESLTRHPAGIDQYLGLLRTLEFSERDARALADALADWIDSDQTRGELGQEDAGYARGRHGYRTAGTLLAEASELRAIRGYTPQVYARLRPHVCALPDDAPTPVNLNTLGPEDAAILSMLTDGELAIERARRIIAARPAGGWRDLLAFWAQPAFADAPPSQTAMNQAVLRTRYFRLHAEVESGPAQVVLSGLFELDGGRARLLSRRWSSNE